MFKWQKCTDELWHHQILLFWTCWHWHMITSCLSTSMIDASPHQQCKWIHTHYVFRCVIQKVGTKRFLHSVTDQAEMSDIFPSARRSDGRLQLQRCQIRCVLHRFLFLQVSDTKCSDVLDKQRLHSIGEYRRDAERHPKPVCPSDQQPNCAVHVN